MKTSKLELDIIAAVDSSCRAHLRRAMEDDKYRTAERLGLAPSGLRSLVDRHWTLSECLAIADVCGFPQIAIDPCFA